MARSFNGSTDKIDATAAAVFNTAALTYSAWVKVTSTGDFSVVCGRQLSSNQIFITIRSSLQISGYVVSSGGDTNFNNSSGSLTSGVWGHVAITYNAPVLTGYLNGTSIASVNNGAGAIASFSADFGIGAYSGQQALTGSVADVAQYSVALTVPEIVALAAGARPNTIRQGSLVAWWPLDGLASPEPDLSGNANNGTLTGTAKVAGPPLAMFTPRWPQYLILPPALTKFTLPVHQHNIISSVRMVAN